MKKWIEGGKDEEENEKTAMEERIEERDYDADEGEENHGGGGRGGEEGSEGREAEEGDEAKKKE